MATTSSQRKRITRQDLFMEIAHMFGERSTCPRASVGVVAVRDGRIIATGYNGAPAGMPHCLDVGCEIAFHSLKAFEEKKGHCIRAVHAEANLVAWAARVGISLEACELYSTHEICNPCAKLLINAGIRGVHFCEEYGGPAGAGTDLLRLANVLVWHERSC